MKKAKFKAALHDRYGKYVDLLYEYKNEEYFVRRYFAGNASDEELWMQHRAEQNRIDAHQNADHTEPKATGTFDADEIFALMGWD